ncbi:hypothetical protein R5W24_004833 [Gemmata sp. JC717]|uniref:hypothetical protein n=1 Tax=Gemmata algarum TaxID=2975278 RepID=UPI0021BAF7BD|nr:hypothetical protein [Gemmata algarum]MDY3555688.1 hypothetical protein [Gemmata algarum]
MLRRPGFFRCVLRGERCSSTAIVEKSPSISTVWNNLAGRRSVDIDGDFSTAVP